MGKVHMHLKGSECAQLFFLPRSALLTFYQSINNLYLSFIYKAYGVEQSKKKKYKTTIIIIVQ